MKLVKHGDAAILLIEHTWEKVYLKAQQGVLEWVPLFLPGEATPFAQIHAISHHMRLCAGQQVLDQQKVVFHEC
ncbi:MAG: hypothetical protein JOZ18_09510 [Chloroflexi bacterium]|nr:hypothetical protein [Chloroflexota bacterium]